MSTSCANDVEERLDAHCALIDKARKAMRTAPPARAELAPALRGLESAVASGDVDGATAPAQVVRQLLDQIANPAPEGPKRPVRGARRESHAASVPSVAGAIETPAPGADVEPSSLASIAPVVPARAPDDGLPRALELAQLGCYVFASQAKNRHPAGWPQKATRDVAALQAAWPRGHQPSIFTGKFGEDEALLVVDEDPRHGGDESLEALKLVEGEFPPTRVHGTPSGGRHFIFSMPAPGVKNSASELGQGLDIRSAGGLIHFGTGYSVVSDAPIAPAPAWLIEACTPQANVAAPDRSRDVIDTNDERARQVCEIALAEATSAVEPGRNIALHRFALQLNDLGISIPLRYEYGLRFAAEKCSPPYEDESQARKTIRSAILGALNPAGSRSEINDVRHAAIAQEFEVLPPLETPAVIIARSPLDWALLAQKQPPQREWLMEEWLTRDPTYCGGKGGIGKTLLAQQTASALAIGRSYIASVARPYSVLMWACEDDHDELWRRQVAIASYFGVPLEAFKPRLIIEPRRGRDNTLYALLRGAPRFTKLMEELAAQVNDYQADVVIIDNVGQTFGANENERHPVTAFMNGLAGVGRGRRVAPVLLAHPAKAQGSEYSGSTAWEAAVRMRWFMGDTLPDAKQDDGAEPDPLVRYISKRKQNYTVKDYRKLRFQGGALHPSEPPAPEATLDRENYAAEIVLDGLARITGMGLHATQSSASQNYLPKLLKAHELDGGCTPKELATAMRVALTNGRLRVGVVGHYSNRTEKHGLIAVEALHK